MAIYQSSLSRSFSQEIFYFFTMMTPTRWIGNGGLPNVSTSSSSSSSSFYYNRWKTIAPTSVALIVLGLIGAHGGFSRDGTWRQLHQGTVSNLNLYYRALRRLVEHLTERLHQIIMKQHPNEKSKGSDSTSKSGADYSTQKGDETCNGTNPGDWTVIEHDGMCDCGAVTFSMTAPRTLHVLKRSTASSGKIDFPKSKIPISSFEINDPHDQLKKYQTLRFCSRCSVPLLQTQTDGSRTHFVNVRCLQSDWIPIYVDKESDLQYRTLPSLEENNHDNNKHHTGHVESASISDIRPPHSACSSNNSTTNFTRLAVDRATAPTAEPPWPLRSLNDTSNRPLFHANTAVTSSSSFKLPTATDVTECPTMDTESTISSVRSNVLHGPRERNVTNHNTRFHDLVHSTEQKGKSSATSLRRLSIESVTAPEPSPNQLRRFMSKHLTSSGSSSRTLVSANDIKTNSSK